MSAWSNLQPQVQQSMCRSKNVETNKHVREELDEFKRQVEYVKSKERPKVDFDDVDFLPINAETNDMC